MSDCCSKNSTPEPIVTGSCCAQKTEPAMSEATGCCPSENSAQPKFDWLLWGSFAIVASGYALHLIAHGSDWLPHWLAMMSHGVFELMNTMWWGVLAAFFFVGVLAKVPQQMVIAVLGQGGTKRGLARATLAGVMLDLCSHGILMVGVKLYERGASLGQVMAFLIASPWNSLSLTIILVALIGLPWTLLFIVLSMMIALISGWIFERLVQRGTLPGNPNTLALEPGYELWPDVKFRLRETQWNSTLFKELLSEGVRGSRIVLRWLLFGVVLATALRSFLSLDDFQNWFGPTVLGLVVTLIAATIIEVCSEGSAPLAADLMNRAKAPGNSFAFMMTGVSTDYTEVMVLKESTRSWKIALFLPLVTVPQVILLALLMNHFAV